MLTKENCFITGATLILRWSCFLFVLIVVVNFPKRDQTLQIRRSNHGLGSFANSTQLILWNYWELRMSGGGYAMHRLLVLRFILRSGNLEALLHHSDICVKLSRHMFVYACICVVTGNLFSKLSFQTIFSSYFEKCCFGQFFLEIVILDKYFFTNCFCRSRQFFFENYANLLIWVALVRWSGWWSENWDWSEWSE